ncbi:PREDICTED: transmembrane protein 183B-like isoform X2 [Polistes canadensis]|uniref:transmembrane protein 183B-like isoform X2 n=1 Tax=Polistes canadensis TaxID=91411 RepID=UPI000718F7CC|nr:PREDICTED: transmembrane protein 183B-like isoform X2 [Polistes canadensis]
MSQTQHKTLVKDLLPKKQLRNQKKISNEEITERNGIDYPLDIWFIISEYIKPETVGKFACICKSSYYVTTTAKFWFHLYKTYYKFVPGIPERLQPHWMILRHELRLCVIRTLHYTYFAERRALSYISRIQQKEPHSLVKRQCSLMWHEKGTNRWYFFFKLKEISGTCNGTLIQQNKSMDDDIDTAEKINANSEEKCKLLQKVSVTLMPGLKYLRLQLGFGTSDLPNALTNQVILNDVIDYEVFDWWHPRYPHQDTISYLCDVDSTIQLTSDDTWD